jgi:hypothetical protein
VFEVIKAAPFGDCGFSAIRAQLHANQNRSMNGFVDDKALDMKMRDTIAIRARSILCAGPNGVDGQLYAAITAQYDGTGETVEEYFDAVADGTAWADQRCLIIAANLFNLPINLYTRCNTDSIMYIRNTFNDPIRPIGYDSSINIDCINLVFETLAGAMTSNRFHGHYDSLIKFNGTPGESVTRILDKLNTVSKSASPSDTEAQEIRTASPVSTLTYTPAADSIPSHSASIFTSPRTSHTVKQQEAEVAAVLATYPGVNLGLIDCLHTHGSSLNSSLRKMKFDVECIDDSMAAISNVIMTSFKHSFVFEPLVKDRTSESSPDSAGLFIRRLSNGQSRRIFDANVSQIFLPYNYNIIPGTKVGHWILIWFDIVDQCYYGHDSLAPNTITLEIRNAKSKLHQLLTTAYGFKSKLGTRTLSSDIDFDQELYLYSQCTLPTQAVMTVVCGKKVAFAMILVLAACKLTLPSPTDDHHLCHRLTYDMFRQHIDVNCYFNNCEFTLSTALTTGAATSNDIKSKIDALCESLTWLASQSHLLNEAPSRENSDVIVIPTKHNTVTALFSSVRDSVTVSSQSLQVLETDIHTRRNDGTLVRLADERGLFACPTVFFDKGQTIVQLKGTVININDYTVKDEQYKTHRALYYEDNPNLVYLIQINDLGSFPNSAHRGQYPNSVDRHGKRLVQNCSYRQYPDGWELYATKRIETGDSYVELLTNESVVEPEPSFTQINQKQDDNDKTFEGTNSPPTRTELPTLRSKQITPSSPPLSSSSATTLSSIARRIASDRSPIANAMIRTATSPSTFTLNPVEQRSLFYTPKLNSQKAVKSTTSPILHPSAYATSLAASNCAEQAMLLLPIKPVTPVHPSASSSNALFTAASPQALNGVQQPTPVPSPIKTVTTVHTVPFSVQTTTADAPSLKASHSASTTSSSMSNVRPTLQADNGKNTDDDDDDVKETGKAQPDLTSKTPGTVERCTTKYIVKGILPDDNNTVSMSGRVLCIEYQLTLLKHSCVDISNGRVVNTQIYIAWGFRTVRRGPKIEQRAFTLELKHGFDATKSAGEIVRDSITGKTKDLVVRDLKLLKPSKSVKYYEGGFTPVQKSLFDDIAEKWKAAYTTYLVETEIKYQTLSKAKAEQKQSTPPAVITASFDSDGNRKSSRIVDSVDRKEEKTKNRVKKINPPTTKLKEPKTAPHSARPLTKDDRTKTQTSAAATTVTKPTSTSAGTKRKRLANMIRNTPISAKKTRSKTKKQKGVDVVATAVATAAAAVAAASWKDDEQQSFNFDDSVHDAVEEHNMKLVAQEIEKLTEQNKTLEEMKRPTKAQKPAPTAKPTAAASSTYGLTTPTQLADGQRDVEEAFSNPAKSMSTGTVLSVKPTNPSFHPKTASPNAHIEFEHHVLTSPPKVICSHRSLNASASRPLTEQQINGQAPLPIRNQQNLSVATNQMIRSITRSKIDHPTQKLNFADIENTPPPPPPAPSSSSSSNGMETLMRAFTEDAKKRDEELKKRDDEMKRREEEAMKKYEIMMERMLMTKGTIPTAHSCSYSLILIVCLCIAISVRAFQ